MFPQLFTVAPFIELVPSELKFVAVRTQGAKLNIIPTLNGVPEMLIQIFETLELQTFAVQLVDYAIKPLANAVFTLFVKRLMCDICTLFMLIVELYIKAINPQLIFSQSKKPFV
ncbi:Hypothetical_protein [Hexamita inflata]|uniref:Hypothetical_protein n=1 Tax=Hexamita inflata TaxID=28002 RepID=A0ABP1HC97_9EUKA